MQVVITIMTVTNNIKANKSSDNIDRKNKFRYFDTKILKSCWHYRAKK